MINTAAPSVFERLTALADPTRSRLVALLERQELTGDSPDRAFLGLLDDRWVVGDLGCGTGWLTASIAPFVRRVVAVDASPEMLEAATSRLQTVPNVDVRSGDLEKLPLEDQTL